MTSTGKLDVYNITIGVYIIHYLLSWLGFGGSGEYPEQESTGSRGYFGKRGSVAESWQRAKTEPRADAIRRA
jgi:hypothetical protein